MPVNPVDVGQQPPSPVPTVICAGTIRQRDPPFFTGKGNYDAEDWLSTFERVNVYNKWDDQAKLSNVEYYLREVAEVWFRNNGRTIKTWGEFKTLFAEAFDRPEVRKLHAEQCLRVRAQQPGENFTSYIEDVVDLCRRINMDMSEQEKIRHILKGIEDDAFQMLMSKDRKTVAEIIKLCQSYDELRRQRSFVRQSLGTGAELSSLSFSSEQASLEMRIKDFVREEVARQLSLVPFVEQPAPSLPQAVQRTVREQVAEALSPAHQSTTPAAPLTVPTMATVAPPVTAPLTYAECAARAAPPLVHSFVPSFGPYMPAPVTFTPQPVFQFRRPAPLAKEDPWIATIVNFLSSPSTLPQPRALRRQAAHFAISDNLLYRRNYMPDGRKWLLVVPRNLRAEASRHAEECGRLTRALTSEE
ncbi:uncharacterized protein LOC144180213 [Haemaphysalis longicornis]